MNYEHTRGGMWCTVARNAAAASSNGNARAASCAQDTVFALGADMARVWSRCHAPCVLRTSHMVLRVGAAGGGTSVPVMAAWQGSLHTHRVYPSP